MPGVLPVGAYRDAPLLFHTPTRDDEPDPIQDGQAHASVLSPGCIIEGDALVEHSVLGYQVHIGEKSHVEHCVLLGADKHHVSRGRVSERFYTTLGEGCWLRRCILDKNVLVGDDVWLAGVDRDKRPLWEQERVSRMDSIKMANGEPLQRKIHYDVQDGILVIGKPMYRGHPQYFEIPSGFTA